MSKSPRVIVSLGQESELKKQLNRGIASLQDANGSVLNPHVCLNGIEGIEVLERISSRPEIANTEIRMRLELDEAGENLWFNISFTVFLDSFTWPTNMVKLSPRQTSHIVRNLPDAHRQTVLEMVRVCCLNHFLPNINKGLATISAQIETGNLLLANEDENRVFDIHGEQAMDVPHTEIATVGRNLFWSIAFGGTCLETGSDGLVRADKIIMARAQRQRDVANNLLSLMRGFEA